MSVVKVAAGLWRWTAPHPDWTEAEEWPREVGCVYYESPDGVVLIDPLIPPDRDTFFEALDADVARVDGPVSILLTVAWHSRSAAELAERYDARRGELPGGVVEVPVPEFDETAYWIPQHLAVVVGDTLLGDEEKGLSLCPESWIQGDARAALRGSLRSLLELPVERVLTSHGEPVLANGHAALDRALRD